MVHPHVLAIYGVNGDGKLPYLIMPLVSGQSLQERIDRQGPLGVKDVLRIGMQAAQGLAAAHAQGLVHRDVKPANILLENSVDRVLLMDFGLARAADDASLTHSGVIAGTPQFMSPEQTRGGGIDHRTDLFSLVNIDVCNRWDDGDFLLRILHENFTHSTARCGQCHIHIHRSFAIAKRDDFTAID